LTPNLFNPYRYVVALPELLWEYTETQTEASLRPTEVGRNASIGWRIPSAQNGKSVTSVTFRVKEYNYATGQIWADIYDSTPSLTATSIKQDVSTIGETYDEITFTFDSASAILTGGYIVVTGDFGDVNNYVLCTIGNADGTADSCWVYENGVGWIALATLGTWIKVYGIP